MPSSLAISFHFFQKICFCPWPIGSAALSPLLPTPQSPSPNALSLNFFFANVRICVYAHSRPHLNPLSPQKSACPSSSVRHHSPFDGSPTSKMSSSKSSLLVFHPFVLNKCPSVSRLLTLLFFHSAFLFFVPYRLGWPPAYLSLSPLVAWSCTLAIHLPPLPIQMSQYVPGTMKVQLESHVVVQLRISPLINKMSDWPLLFCSLSFSLSYFIIGMWEYI